MSLSLLSTKFYIPPLRQDIVRRQNLVEKLDSGLNRKLTLISAPAGFGKSTLVGEWVENSSKKVAWLSLEEKDSDFTRFFLYFIGALKQIDTVKGAENLGDKSIEVLNEHRSTLPEDVLAPLLNQISSLNERIVIVLDDYHLIESDSIHDAIAFLIEQMPRTMNLVLLTRQDPPLPLARLRAGNDMTEIRAMDLRFTPIEVRQFMKQTMRLEISEENILTLASRTEGWAAGLQLAGVSLKGSDDIASDIKSFAGSNRHVTDYLLQEVLNRQDGQTREFLLTTSILGQLTGPLCDALLKRKNGQQMIEFLEQANLFVVPLDNERRWYRYHHLFGELLRQNLQQTSPEKITGFHTRASEWFQGRNHWPEAIHHALASKNNQRAADLAELSWPEWNAGYQTGTWLSWIKDLPVSILRTRPVLSAAFAFSYLNAGRLEDAESRLVDAEACLNSTNQIDTVFVDKEQFEALPAWIATIRGYHAQAAGKVEEAVKYINRVLELLPGNDYYQRASATALLGLAHWSSGNLKAAHKIFAGGIFQTDEDRIVGTFVLADIELTLGRLQDAIGTCEHTLHLVSRQETPNPRGTEDVFSAYSELLREQGDLRAAAENIDTAQLFGDKAELIDWRYRWCVSRARLSESSNNLDAALDNLEEAERVFVRTPLPVVRPISAMKARIWIRQGRLEKAIAWASEQTLSVSDELSFIHEFEHITLARILIARKFVQSDTSHEDVKKYLVLLEGAAEEGNRIRNLIEILILQALFLQSDGNDDSAMDYLEKAMNFAKKEGFIQVFIDEGQEMATLLHKFTTRKTNPEFAIKLIQAFPESPAEPAPIQSGLVEPLSERELEVLQLIGEGLSNEEVGTRLFISPHTAKTHTRSIFAKLDVHNRITAIAKAKTIGIL